MADFMTNDSSTLITIANELEAFILSVVPQATTVNKYGGVLFTVHPEEKEGQFCGVFIYKQHVQLAFSLGAQLDDPHKLLAGSGKYRRHTNFTTLEDLDYAALEKLLLQAMKLS